MRRALTLIVLVCMAGACNDDNESPLLLDASTQVDASTPSDASVPADATTPPRSLLPRFGGLERPPTALPDDLKPPR
ncbi:MAG TPA: hypothetical protein VFX59_20205 [Polyangiales bacterium]|nr:hypothetical protein [Polyangiales bacterium]